MKKKLLFLFVSLLTSFGAWAQNEDMLSTPLTLEAIEAGVITFNNNAEGPVTYRVNGGEVQSIGSKTTGNIAINAGDKVAFFGDNETYGYFKSTWVNSQIFCTSDCYIYGNIMSLISSADYANLKKLTEIRTFMMLFSSNTHIKIHPKNTLELPATTLTDLCYNQMFYGCTGLTKAPELPATTLTYRCYNLMFYGCKNLSSVTCLATDISASSCTSSWLSGVSSTGTFTKVAGVEWPTGSNGIPEGWLVIEETPEDEDMLSTPLTLEAIKPGSITFDNKAAGPVTYRVNGGETWTIESGMQGSISVNAHDQVAFYGDNQSYGYYDNTTYSVSNSLISCTSDCYIYGNIMSLISSTDFANAKTLDGNYTFNSLFKDNTQLKNHPTKTLELPATTLAYGCYEAMFKGCWQLTEAPGLPATTLTNLCYSQMFSGCTALTKAPALPAMTLTASCYNGMFSGCTRLRSVTCLATNISANNCTTGWLKGVWYSGTFNKAAGVKWPTGESGIPNGWTVIEETPENEGMLSTPLTLEVIEPGKITFDNKAEGPVTYRVNGSEGQIIEKGTKGSIIVNAGDKVAFYGNNGTYTRFINGRYFDSQISCTSDCYIYGNIMSLISSTNFANAKTLNGNYSFSSLFKDNTKVKNHPTKTLELPATTLAYGCYYSMFYGCTNLTEVPALPATTLAESCYEGMFYRCTGLTEVPVLPAITLAQNCYAHMFQGCTALTKAPSLSVQTMAKNSCYQMFRNCKGLIEASEITATEMADSCCAKMYIGCTNLKKAPKLTVRTMADYCCYQMYSDCTNLVEAGEISATVMKKYSCYSMFSGCMRLTNAPELPATTLAYGCYYSMFYGCTNLTEAPALPAMTLAESCYEDMFSGCTSLTEAPVLPAKSLIRSCYESMFSGCTSLTEALVLPATTLDYKCYAYMFEGCTGLSKAPVLPATTLATSCYEGMFEGCTGLKSVTCLAKNITANSSTANWLKGVSTTGTFYKAEGMNDWLFGIDGIPIGWTVEDYGEEIPDIPEIPQYEDILSTPLTLKAIESGSIIFHNQANGPVGYRLNYGKMQIIDSRSTGKISVNAGDEVEFYGNNETYTRFQNGNYDSPSQISCTSDCYVYGNVMSLISSTDYATLTTLDLEEGYTFCCLFKDNTQLKNHPTKTLELPATTLAYGCYGDMFSGCTGLTEAPVLPATTLAKGCYFGMFSYCGLTEAPVLSATTLADSCYNEMFLGCTGLTKAPELPATTLAEGCYEHMFSGCKNLNKVTCLATDISASRATAGWLYDVSATGTFYKHPDMKDWSTGSSGIPEGWTVVDYVMTGISGTTAGVKKAATTTYDLRGMKSTAGKKGLKIVGDKKILTR